jgi:hypothetical protein
MGLIHGLIIDIYHQIQSASQDHDTDRMWKMRMWKMKTPKNGYFSDRGPIRDPDPKKTEPVSSNSSIWALFSKIHAVTAPSRPRQVRFLTSGGLGP